MEIPLTILDINFVLNFYTLNLYHNYSELGSPGEVVGLQDPPSSSLI